MNKATIYANTISMRAYLLPVMIQEFGDECAMCHCKAPSYAIDHLKYGDDITMYDLQLLCVDCHNSKTSMSNEVHLTRTPHCVTCTCYEHNEASVAQ